MRISQAAARIYAKALFDIGVDGDSLDRISDELHAVRTAFDSVDTELRGFFAMPQLPRDAKRKVLDQAFGDKLSRTVQGFLRVLVDKRRELLFPAIIEEFDDLLDERAGKIKATVVTAQPLDIALVAALREAIEQRTQQQVVLEELLDPNVIGGIRVSLGDLVIDGTVRRALSDMRQTLNSTLA